MDEVIIVINPGSTSTKMALFQGTEKVAEAAVSHPADELDQFENVADQFELRMRNIDEWLDQHLLENVKVTAVAGRGARLCPLDSGAYGINDRMLQDLHAMKYSNHAGNLGAIIADFLGRRFGVPAIIYDPITVDGFNACARISGVPEIERVCRSHALNIREICRRQAEAVGAGFAEVNFVAAHLGGGISVAAVEKGRIVDVNDALLGMGPFSTERAGALPIGPLVDLAYSGGYTRKELINKLSRESGLKAYLGESDLRRIEAMIDAGDEKAALYFHAMVYQVAKEIGACVVVLKGNLQAIVITGGMARSERLVNTLREYISFLGPVSVVPGEFEMEALAAGARRVLAGQEIIKEY